MEKPFFIQPWLTSDEFISCYETMFSSLNAGTNSTIDEFINSLNVENLKAGYNKLIIWEGRNDNKTFVLSSLLLLDSIIKIKENKFSDSFNKLDAHHVLGEIVIRVTNLLIDELKKKRKKNKSSMFLVAKEIKLPEYIIEIRHASTHKNIPSMKSLRLSVTFLFKWVKENMWDKLYLTLKNEFTLYTQIKECFNTMSMEPLGLIDDDNENNNVEDNEDEEDDDDENKIKFEIHHLMDIVQLFFICWKKSFYDPIDQPLLRQNYERNTSFCVEIFEFLDNKENELFILLLFKFIAQQMKNIMDHNANNYVREIEMLIQFSIFLLRHQHLEQSDFKPYDILIFSIYSNLKIMCSENASFTSIFNNFRQLFLNTDFKKSAYENDEFNIMGTFNINNTQNEEQIFHDSNNNIYQMDSENNLNMDQIVDDKNIYDTLIL